MIIRLPRWTVSVCRERPARWLLPAVPCAAASALAGMALLAPAEPRPAIREPDGRFVPAVGARVQDPEVRQQASRPAGHPVYWRREHLAGPYRAEIIRVLDGDTVEARIRIWLGQDITTRIRLRGIDAPELKARCAAEARLAREARLNLRQLLRSGPVEVVDIGPGKYAGRVIAALRVREHSGSGTRTTDAGQMLLAGGYARPYRRGRRGGWCTAASMR